MDAADVRRLPRRSSPTRRCRGQPCRSKWISASPHPVHNTPPVGDYSDGVIPRQKRFPCRGHSFRVTITWGGVPPRRPSRMHPHARTGGEEVSRTSGPAGGALTPLETPPSVCDGGVLVDSRPPRPALGRGCVIFTRFSCGRRPADAPTPGRRPRSAEPGVACCCGGRLAGAGAGRRPGIRVSRSQNVCPHRLTHDHSGSSVCRVPREPDPDWIIEQRRAIGDRVRAIREHVNLTQEQLAYQSGSRA